MGLKLSVRGVLHSSNLYSDVVMISFVYHVDTNILGSKMQHM